MHLFVWPFSEFFKFSFRIRSFSRIKALLQSYCDGYSSGSRLTRKLVLTSLPALQKDPFHCLPRCHMRRIINYWPKKMMFSTHKSQLTAKSQSQTSLWVWTCFYRFRKKEIFLKPWIIQSPLFLTHSRF